MLIFEQIRTGGDRNFGYLVGDSQGKKAVLVDPSWDPNAMVERAQAQGLEVTHIINTHGHHDHTNGNDEAKRLTGAPLVAHRAAKSDPEVAVEHEDTLAVGELTLTFLFTPGHAEDHLCVQVEDVCMTGDLLFVGKVGGTGSDESARTEYRSLHEILLRLPDDTTVWPGHDYGCRPASTLALEKRINPFLLCPDVDSFLKLKADWATYKSQHGLK